MRKIAIHAAAAVVLAATLAGCRSTAYFLHTLTPPPPAKTVNAEFDQFPDHRVAVVLYSDSRAEYEYPGVRMGLASLIGSLLREKVKDVNVVDARAVARYQAENLHWDEMDRGELGKRLGADYVLYVTLVEYGLREPGSVGLYRGRITAEVSVYDTTLPDRAGRKWRGKDIAVLYPPNSPTGDISEDERDVRRKTEGLFVDLLVKNFYKHKVDQEE